jgi:hypothetical protein
MLRPRGAQQPVLGDAGALLQRQGIRVVDVEAVRGPELLGEVVEQDLVEIRAPR